MTIFGNTKQVIHTIQDYDTVFDNSIPFCKNDLLRITYFRIPGVYFKLCLGTETPAPVTGADSDEYNLNVVDCNASVTVARPEVLNLSQWGSGGYPQPPEANTHLGLQVCHRAAQNFCENLMVFRGLPRACWVLFFLRFDIGIFSNFEPMLRT